MAQESAPKTYKVVKDKLSDRVRICKLLGRERGEQLREGKVIEVSKVELEILKINQWVTLKGGKDGK